MRLVARLTKLSTSILLRRTVRFRLTLLYCMLFLASSAGLVGISYMLVSRQLSAPITTGSSPGLSPSHVTTGGVAYVGVDAGLQAKQAADLHQFLVWSLIALGIMAVVSIALGWLVAGRVLRPVRFMTASARRISDRNLHERLALDGPHDEFKDLGDTIDGLLARLEEAFDSQKRFVANASHELRTPLTLGRTMLQVALANPSLTLNSLRSTCAEVLEAGREQEQLIEALLTLARSQGGLDHRETFDLASIASGAVQSCRQDANARRVNVDTVLDVALVSGDALLVERLVTNLVDNALRYNVLNGHMKVVVGVNVGRAMLRVTNSGPCITADQIERLLQPFQRLEGTRGGDHGGMGLGLSIIAAITRAHGATLGVKPRSEGGLEIEVSFPGTTLDGRHGACVTRSNTAGRAPAGGDLALANRRAESCTDATVHA